MATSRQTLIPVVRLRTKTVLGGINIGSFVNFIGNETTINAISGQAIPIQPYYPDNDRSLVKPWYMAYVVDEDNYRLQEYLAYSDFESVNEFNTKVKFQSPATMPNLVTDVVNTMQVIIAGPRLDAENVAPGIPEATPNPVTGLAYSQNVAVNATISTVSAFATVSAVAVTTGTVPTGLTLGHTGNNITLVGTPSGSGAISFTMEITTEDGEIVVPVSGTIAAAASAAPNPVTGVSRVQNLSATTLLTTVSNGTPSGATVTTGALPAGLTLAVAGQAINLVGTATGTGAISFSMTIATNNGSIVVPVAGTIAAAPSATPNPVTGVARTRNFAQSTTISTVSGGTPTGVSATTGTIPAGTTLTFSGQNIILGGTPTTAGAISFTATVVTANGNVVIPVSGTVAAAPSAAPNPVTGLAPVQNLAYTQNISVISNATPSSVSATTGTVPAGLTLSIVGQNVRLAGTPTGTGAISFTATVVTPVGNVVIPVSGTIAAAPSATPNPVTGLAPQEGVDFGTQNISVVSGGTPTGVSATTGTVPTGMTAGFSGQNVTLSGTPEVGTAGAMSFTLTVVTANGNVVIPVSGTIAAA
jgi:hypothetical protein